MKQIFRNFIYLINKFKISSILNIAGLSIAFAVFLIAIIQVDYDLSYDKHFKKSDNIFTCNCVDEGGDKSFVMNQPTIKAIAEKFPEIINYCQTSHLGQKNYRNKDKEDLSIETIQTSVSKGFINVFTLEIIMGNAEDVFNVTSEVKAIISETPSKKLFGSENPIGKKIIDDNTKDTITILAVCKDFPENSTIKSGVFLALAVDDQIYNSSYPTYFEALPENVKKLEEKINSDETIKEVFDCQIALYPLTDTYKHYKTRGRGQPGTTYSFLSIGLLVLIIAYINFINFSISMAPARVRNINIQKILGLGNIKAKIIVASESVLFSLVSIIISIFIIYFLNNSFISEFISADISIKNNIVLLALVALSAMIFSLIIGLYPAGYVTSFNPAMVLNGKFQFTYRSSVLRNILISIQQISAMSLVIVAIFIKLQNLYVTNYSWGIQKENIIYLPNSLEENFENFGAELMKNSNIQDYTGSLFLPGRVGTLWGRSIDDKKVYFTAWSVRYNFLDFFGVDVIEGEIFTEADKDLKYHKMILNEEFNNEYNFDNILGKELYGYTSSDKIIGIVENINFESLKFPIKPMAFVLSNKSDFHWIFIKVSSNNMSETISYIENIWKKFSDKKFEFNFLDNYLSDLYKKEQNLSKVISFLGLIAVLIAIMGVYVLILFNAKYKEKEIAIRKVNGSSIEEIIFMLNRNILVQLIISFVVAVPIAYFIVNKWLESFAYKIPVYWWVFLLGGLIVFLITIATVSFQSYKAAIVNPVKSLNKE